LDFLTGPETIDAMADNEPPIDSDSSFAEFNYYGDNTNSDDLNSSSSSSTSYACAPKIDYIKMLNARRENPNLYSGCSVKLKEFSVAFLEIIIGNHLARKTVNQLLELISVILPTANKLPLSYNELLKTIDPDDNVIHTACKICSRPSVSEICSDEMCQLQKNKKNIIKKCIQNCNQPVAIIFDFKSQLINLINKEYDNIIDYKSKFIVEYS
jgi:hypothetical protein